MRRCLLILALAVLAYAPGLRSGEAYDDGWVLRNPRIRSPAALLASFTDPTPRTLEGTRLPAYSYRPLTEASFALNLALTGDSPLGLRMGNLLLHALSTLLVFRLARQLGAPAGWTTAVFGLHPLGVQAVTYLCQRSTALETLFLFLTLSFYLDGRRRAAWISALLAALSKETAASLPAVLLALEAVDRRPGLFQRWIPFLAVPLLVGFQMLRVRHAQLELFGRDFSWEPRPGFLAYWSEQPGVLLRYLGLLTFPFPMRFAFDRPPTALPFLPGVLILLGFWILLGRLGRLPRLGLALFLAPLALETFLPLHDGAWNYRCYPGLLGGGILIGTVLRRFPRPAVAVLLLLGALSARENRLWTDAQARLARDVRSAPHRPAAWGDYAWDHLSRHQALPAERLARQGMRLPQASPKAAGAWAYALLAQGRLREGLKALEDANRDFPGDPGLLALAEELRRHLDSPP